MQVRKRAVFEQTLSGKENAEANYEGVLKLKEDKIQQCSEQVPQFGKDHIEANSKGVQQSRKDPVEIYPEGVPQSERDSIVVCSGGVTQIATPEGVPQVNTPKDVFTKDSLWTLAYENLQNADPDLIHEFNLYLEINATDADNGRLTLSGIDQITQRASDELEKAKTTNEKPHKTSAVIRRSFEKILKFIDASNSFISSAVSVNPYAALAWTGVSLLLPVSLFRKVFSKDL